MYVLWLVLVTGLRDQVVLQLVNCGSGVISRLSLWHFAVVDVPVKFLLHGCDSFVVVAYIWD